MKELNTSFVSHDSNYTDHMVLILSKMCIGANVSKFKIVEIFESVICYVITVL